MAAASNPNQINVVIAVDVIRALSDSSLKDNIYLMDNNPFEDGQASTGQGTDYLTTSCLPGQVIQWTIHAIDLQTPVSIKSIHFINEEDSDVEVVDHNEHEARPDLKVWVGVVPNHMNVGQPYRYKLVLQMGSGENSIMSIDSTALKRI